MANSQNIPWKRLTAEGTAIVLSILLAFAIDAWWEDVQSARQQARLVVALQQNFGTTKARLEVSIEYADSLIARTDGFFEAANGNDSVPIDSIRHLAGGAFQKINFEPALSAYESAVATGRLGLIENPKLLKAITDFNQARDSYELHDRITADIHYLGPVWDMRKKYGGLSVLLDDVTGFPGRVQLTDAEYRQLITDPIVTGAIEAVATANESIVANLRKMNEATIAILLELEQLQ